MKNARTSLLLWALPAIASCGIGILSGCPAHAQIEPGRFLYSGDQSIVLQPAARVADDTSDLSWSPDSSRLITFNSHVRPIDAGETEATSEFTVVRWVRSSHAASTLYSIRITGKMALTMPCVWLPTTETAIQDIAWDEHVASNPIKRLGEERVVSHRLLLWIDARSGAVKSLDINSRNILTVSQSRPLAVIIYVARYGTADKPMLATIRLDGSTGKSVEFAGNQRVGHLAWSQDGRRLNFTLSNINDAQKVISSSKNVYDPVSGEVGPQPSADRQPPAAPKQPILQISQQVRQMTEVETSARVRPLWISTTAKSEHPRLLACADADLGVLSPDGTAVAYRSSGSAWVFEFKSIPLAEFKQMLIQAQRQAAMQQGMAVALAALMYAEDNNEILPGAGNISDITKYLGDPNDLSGFNLIYAGGPLAGIEFPAETILGTMDGPGGVAVIYVDGHVKWQGQ